MVEKEQIVFMHFQKIIDGLIFDAPDQEFIQFVNYLSQELKMLKTQQKMYKIK